MMNKTRFVAISIATLYSKDEDYILSHFPHRWLSTKIIFLNFSQVWIHKATMINGQLHAHRTCKAIGQLRDFPTRQRLK